MAYGQKYTISAPQINGGANYQARIYEDGYSGAITDFKLDKFPFEHTLLALSDDPYLPIVPTQLTFRVNITDLTTELPDLTSTDDRKYFVELYEASAIIWQGFIISDNINIPFNTGYVNMDIQCTDGLGLLKDVQYNDLITDINKQSSVGDIIRTCLNQIAWANGFTLNTAFNLYHIDMDSTASAFEQMYISNRFLANKTCYEVLEQLLKSYGCQIYQSSGEWWVVAVNERTAALRYFTTDKTGAGTGTANTINPIVNIGGASEQYHFIDGGQSKILRKGYTIVEVNKDVSTGTNFVNNADLSEVSGSFPVGWSKIELNGGTVGSVGNTFSMQVPGATSVATVACDSAFTVAGITGSDIKNRMSISFTITQDLGTSTDPAIVLIVKLLDANSTDTYYLEGDSSAPDTPYFFNYGTTGLTGFYRVPYDNARAAIGTEITRQINLNNIVIPVSGIVGLEFRLYGQTGTFPKTQPTAIISDFVITTSTDLKEESLTANIGGAINKFKISIDTPIGVGLGTLSRIPDIVGSILKDKPTVFDPAKVYDNNWYDFLTGSVSSPIDYTTLILNRFTQILFKSSINIQGTVRNYLLPNNGATLTDGTGKYSVSGRNYVISNATTNYIDNTSQVTLLETSQTDIIDFSTDIETVSKYGKTV